MKLLQDSNSEVQGMAMKCLAPLAAFVDVFNASYIADKLLEHVLQRSDTKARTGAPDNIGVKAMRDASSLGLKSIFSELKPDSSKALTVAKGILPRIITTIKATKAAGETTDILIEGLELLHEVLSRMGSLLVDMHNDISTAVFDQVLSPSAMVRKRAITCLGALGASCSNNLFVSIVEKTIADLRSSQSPDAYRTGVQAIWALSKTSGHRLGEHLHVLGPILFEFCLADKYSDDDDLREHCMQALESFCRRCRREMVPFGETLAKCVVALAKYDPNYVIEDDEEDEELHDVSDEDDADDVNDEFDDDDYSDDDDSSWKVRRAAIRCLHAAILSQLLPLADLCSQFGPFLVTRFKEREESVKLDVFAAFTDLLHVCNGLSKNKLIISNKLGKDQADPDNVSMDMALKNIPELQPLLERGPQIIRNIKKELNSRSLKTRIRAMGLLRDLVTSAPSVVTPGVNEVVREVEQGLADSATAMKTESLLFLRGLVRGGGAEALKNHISVLMPRVLATTDDRYYKITAECLRFCSAAILSFGKSAPDCKQAMSVHAPPIYDAALARATAPDQDSEVKEAALHCLGIVVSYFGVDLGEERLAAIASTLSNRLGNEVTRLSTVRAMYTIAISERADVLLPTMGEVTTVVGGFLRKSNHSLRIASLELLSVAPVLPSDSDSILLVNISELICDSDLRLAALALQLATKIVKSRGRQISTLIAEPNSIYPRALQLSMSPLLQGRAVESLLGLFNSLAHVSADPLTVEFMLRDLQQLAADASSSNTATSSRNSPLYCIAKCVVTVCDAAETGLRMQTVSQIISSVTGENLRSRIFSLICLGEFGRRSLLTEAEENLQAREAILSAMDGPEEELKTAAALALGGLTSASGASGVPALVNLTKNRPDYRYLLLLALKDAISSAEKSSFAPLVPVLLPMLLEQSDKDSGGQSTRANGDTKGKQTSEEESVRTATAECLGLLAHASPDLVVQALADGATSQSADIRAAVASAIKFSLSSSSSSTPVLISTLRSSLSTFIQLIEDPDVTVAKNALQAVNAIGRSQPALLLPRLNEAVPVICRRTAKNRDLVRIVDLGPFKHEEDYGLDLRKTAFDCVRTIISGPLCAHVRLTTLLEYVVVGLRDQSDVRSIAQLILAIAAATPFASQIVTIMDSIIRALEQTFNERVKENAVRQEAERHDDSIRGALRAVRMLETVPEISSNPDFQSFMASVVRTSRYREKYESIGRSEVELLTFGSMTAAENNFTSQRLDDDAMAD